MISPLLALFIRSLREDARWPATYWTRAAVGGFTLLFLVPATTSGGWSNAPGRELFSSIIIFQMVAVSIVGLSYFASAVTEEKEEHTLGLLRMTGLNPLAILLGKSTSRLFSALLLLTAQFPFTIFAVTLGGVSIRQVVAAYCMLVAFVFLLSNLALLGSVVAPHQWGATTFTLVMMVLLFCLHPLLGALPARWWGALHVSATTIKHLQGACWAATPIARLQEVIRTGFHGAAIGWQVTSNLLLGVGFFLLAWAAFGRSSDRAVQGASADNAAQRRFFGIRLARPPRIRWDPFLWKDFYFLCGGYAGVVLRAIGYGLALLPLIDERIGVLVSFGLPHNALHWIVTGLFTLDVAVMASRIFRVELRDQTMASLIMLPLAVGQITFRKALACVVAGIPGILATIASHILVLKPFIMTEIEWSSAPSTVLFLACKVGSTFVLGLFVAECVAGLSIDMKRGALPVGFAMAYFIRGLILSSSLLTVAELGWTWPSFPKSFSSLSGNNTADFWSALIIDIICLILIAVFYRDALQRLEKFAVEN